MGKNLSKDDQRTPEPEGDPMSKWTKIHIARLRDLCERKVRFRGRVAGNECADVHGNHFCSWVTKGPPDCPFVLGVVV